MILRLIHICIICCLIGCSDSKSITDKVSDDILYQLAKQMKKDNLIAIGSGGGCTIDKKINLISMTFEYRNVLSLSHARELMVKCVQTVLTLTNSDPDNKQYFENFPISDEIILISILSEACPKDPECVEAVSILKGKIYYDVNHPIPHVAPYLTIKEESFEEAQQIVALRRSHGEGQVQLRL